METNDTGFDYSETPYADFTIRCLDGELRFSRYVMGKSPVFAAMLKFGGDEAEKSTVEVHFSRPVFNVLLNYIDPVNGVRVERIPDIVEVAKAAHQYDVRNLLIVCKKMMISEPKPSYLAFTEYLFPDIHREMAISLAEKSLLEGISKHIYMDLFESHLSVRLVAEQYARDGYKWDDEIDVSGETTATLYKLAEIFDDVETTKKLFEIASRRREESPTRKKSRILANRLVYFRMMCKNDPEYYSRYITPSIEEKAREMNELRGLQGIDTARMQIISRSWNFIKNTPAMEEVKKEYDIVKKAFDIIYSKAQS